MSLQFSTINYIRLSEIVNVFSLKFEKDAIRRNAARRISPTGGNTVNSQKTYTRLRFSDTSQGRRSVSNQHTQPERCKSDSPVQSVHTVCVVK